MTQGISIVLSSLALLISATTAWLTLFKRGVVRMVRPSVVYFGPDGGMKAGNNSKVYIRALLFCTAKRGRIIESMYVSLRRNESKQNFSIWVYGEGKLARGSGLYVKEEGVLSSHHFLPPRDFNNFMFTEGTYKLEVFAKLFGTRKEVCLFRESLILDAAMARSMAAKGRGVYFDWGPDANRYIPHIEDILPEEAIQHESSSDEAE